MSSLKQMNSSYTPEQFRASIAQPNWIVRMDKKADKSRAGNPCRTRFNAVQYFRCYPLLLLMSPVAFGLMLALAWWKGIDQRIGLAVGIGLAVVCPIQAIATMMKKFSNGNVNPGFVVDDSHVAVFADLAATSREPHNAIKVIYAPLSKMAGGPYRKGDRVPTTAFYNGPPDSSGAWTDVHPFPVAAGTTDLVALARLKMSISEDEWNEAKRCVDRMKSSTPTLQRLWTQQ